MDIDKTYQEMDLVTAVSHLSYFFFAVVKLQENRSTRLQASYSYHFLNPNKHSVASIIQVLLVKPNLP